MTTLITKFDGSKQPYDEDKIRSSATRVGVPSDLQEQMLVTIRDRLYDGITTKEIFDMIKEFLQNSSSPHLAMKYNLKEALAQLGPSGYPFEKYIALLLVELGYTTKTNQIIEGSCVSHEVDVLAVKDGTTYFIEAKFHKSPAQRSDVRISLYIKARYDDLASAWPNGPTRPWIITNTRFSTDAIKYSQCQNIRLTSWGYPKGEGIMDLIEQTHLHPVTIIDALSKDDKARLMASGVVACRQLLDPANHSLLPKKLLDSLLPHLSKICQNQV